MRVCVIALSVALAAMLLHAPLGWSHHSNSAFLVEKIIEVKGVVTEWRWVNPHTWLSVTAGDGNGGTIEWSIEGRAPGVLGRVGWTRNTLKPGDMVTVHFSPAKDGSRTGLVARVTLADGTVMSNGGPANQ